jgi:hypothetical protein
MSYFQRFSSPVYLHSKDAKIRRARRSFEGKAPLQIKVSLQHVSVMTMRDCDSRRGCQCAGSRISDGSSLGCGVRSQKTKLGNALISNTTPDLRKILSNHCEGWKMSGLIFPKHVIRLDDRPPLSMTSVVELYRTRFTIHAKRCDFVRLPFLNCRSLPLGQLMLVTMPPKVRITSSFKQLASTKAEHDI